MGRIGNTLAVLAALAVWAAAPLAQAETLSDALIAAYRNSNLLDQNRALLRAADEDVASAMADVRPVVSFALQSTYRNAEVTNFFGQEFTTDSLNTAATLSWDLTLLDFGRDALAIEAAKETVLATRGVDRGRAGGAACRRAILCADPAIAGDCGPARKQCPADHSGTARGQ